MGPRVLLCRPDHLGDILLTFPAVRALRRALPDAHLTYLVSEGQQPVPAHCPDIDAILGLPFPPPDAAPDSPGWAGTVRSAAAEMHGRFDLALLWRPGDPWTGALVAAAGIPLRLGYDHPLVRLYLTASVPMVPRRHAGRAALDLAGEALRQLGRPSLPRMPRWSPLWRTSPAEEAEVDGALEEAGLARGERPIVVHPGSGWPLKSWPEVRWAALAAELARVGGAPPLITGSAAEREAVENIVRASGGRARGLAGSLGLGGLAALLRRARLVIANDSGPLHLAALVGALVLGLYGPADPAVFGPWCPPSRRRILVAAVPCRPCNTMVDPPCGVAAEPACLAEVEVGRALAAAAEMLAGTQTASGLTGPAREGRADC